MTNHILSLDVEHSFGIMRPWEKGFYVTAVGLVTNSMQEHVVWFDHNEHMPSPFGIQTIQHWVNWANIIVGHNLKHDINILRHRGVDFESKGLYCTKITDYLLSGQDTHSLKFDLNSVARRYGIKEKEDKIRTYWDSGVDTCDIPVSVLKPYVLQDCRIPLAIRMMQKRRAEDFKMTQLIRLQNEYQLVVSDMEINGFKLDVDRAEEIIAEYSAKIKPIVKKVKEMTGEEHLNIGSPIQLSAILYGGVLKTKWKEWTIKTYKTIPESKYWEKQCSEEKQIDGFKFTPLPRTKREDGYYKTDKETISQLRAKTKEQREIKKLLAEHSVASKVVETLRGKKKNKGLLGKIQPDGKVHPKLNLTIARNGRSTSSDPNGQNLPRSGTSPIKECIVPEYDGILEVDLKQIEWRDAAELSGDQVMIQEVNSGIDQHNETCVYLMERVLNKENRQEAKVFNFRYVYGGSVWGYYLDPNMPNFSVKKWKAILKAANEKYNGLTAWQGKNIQDVWNNDGYLQIKTGRRFKFHKTKYKDGIFVYNNNQIKNYPVSGVAGGDCLPLCAVVFRRGMKRYNLKSKLILTVHDSIVVDYIEDELETLIKLGYGVANKLHWYMQNYFIIPWETKLSGEVSIGPNYGSLKEVKE
jgi:DNA polymerase-1